MTTDSTTAEVAAADVTTADVTTVKPGFSLPRSYYTDPGIYARDLDRVWGHNWIWVGHASQVPNSGDFFRFDVGDESVIVVRDGNNRIQAHQNVCRHRGSRVCLSQSGNTSQFTCPYHAWSYALDGSLKGGRQMPDDFNPASYGLLPVQLLEFQGLLFISFSSTPPAIEGALDRLATYTTPFGFDQLKVAHQQSYIVPANWKLALENYLECYHCAPSHREYSRSHSLKDPESMTEALVGSMEEKSKQAGLVCGTLDEGVSSATEPGANVYYRRYPLFDGYVTGSQSGKALAPMLGSLQSFDSGASDVTIGPLNHFLAYTDHLVGYRFVPKAVDQTEMQIAWLVHSDAAEGVDYHLKELTWLWDVTTKDDERIIRHNQEGVNSAFYQPGPLSMMEWGIAEFHENYFTFLGDR